MATSRARRTQVPPPRPLLNPRFVSDVQTLKRPSFCQTVAVLARRGPGGRQLTAQEPQRPWGSARPFPAPPPERVPLPGAESRVSACGRCSPAPRCPGAGVPATRRHAPSCGASGSQAPFPPGPSTTRPPSSGHCAFGRHTHCSSTSRVWMCTARRWPTAVAWPRPAPQLAGRGSARASAPCDGSRELLAAGSGDSAGRVVLRCLALRRSRPAVLASVVSDALVVRPAARPAGPCTPLLRLVLRILFHVWFAAVLCVRCDFLFL